MTLAEEMMRYRASHRIGQRKFAEMCGLTTQTVNRVECGKQKASKMTELKIRMVLEKEQANG